MSKTETRKNESSGCFLYFRQHGPYLAFLAFGLCGVCCIGLIQECGTGNAIKMEATVSTVFRYFEKRTIGISAARDVVVSMQGSALNEAGEICSVARIESIIDEIRKTGTDVDAVSEVVLAHNIFVALKHELRQAAEQRNCAIWLVSVAVKSRDTEGVYHE